jgi:hypothetical protein
VAVTMPFARSFSSMVASRLIAPRILNAPISWMFSSFTNTSAPTRLFKTGLLISGVGSRKGFMTFRARLTSAIVIGDGGESASEPQSVASRCVLAAGVIISRSYPSIPHEPRF